MDLCAYCRNPPVCHSQYLCFCYDFHLCANCFVVETELYSYFACPIYCLINLWHIHKPLGGALDPESPYPAGSGSVPDPQALDPAGPGSTKTTGYPAGFRSGSGAPL